MVGDESMADLATHIQTETGKELIDAYFIRGRYSIENDTLYRLGVTIGEVGTDLVAENWGIKKSPY